MNPLKSAAVIIGGLVAIAGSVVAVLMGSDVLTPEAKGVVGLVAGIILAVLGGAQVIVRQLQGEDPEHPAEPLRWVGGKGNGAAGLVLALGASLALGACAPAWQAGGMAVALGGQACEPAQAECRAACERDLSDPWEREAAEIACDCGARYCDLGRRWAAHEIARKAAEAAAREAAEQSAPAAP